jgi:hypothetical protein
MPPVCTIGGAAGVAAALACADNKNVREIDVQKVRDILRANGAVVD